jgi:hypothetical protein
MRQGGFRSDVYCVPIEAWEIPQLCAGGSSDRLFQISVKRGEGVCRVTTAPYADVTEGGEYGG